MSGQIPKRIIQFRIGAQVTQTLRTRAVMSSMTLWNPDYEYLFFSDGQVKELIDRDFPEYKSVFYSFPLTIQKCDFFRYLAIYRYGGFYFDSDVLLASNLSVLLDYGCIFPFEAITLSHHMRDNLQMDWQIGNYAFGATAGHPFLKAIIENCVRGQKDRNWVKPMMRGCPPFLNDQFFIINSTGPGLVSRTLGESRELAKTVTILFPDDICDRRNWNHFGEFGVHLMDSSWRVGRSFLRRKFTGYWWSRIERKRVQQSQKLGKTRDYPCKHTSVNGQIPKACKA